ncbi:MAG TPA: GNAT family N-acetyltransferase [Caulobacteraceae bacterium]|nr:GNAT family N-acetyltransferase [Caulobacteraceae bacterium]
MIDQLTRTPALGGPAIRTARLDLRPPQPSDAWRLTALANDFDVVRMTGSMPWPYTLADAEAWVAHAQRADPSHAALFVIDLPGEGPIGVIGLDPDGEMTVEVGYWLGQPYWGRGYATEALRGLLAWARDGWGRRWITARHFADNPASGVVLIKAGFLYTGRTGPWPCRARGEDVATRWMVWLA